MLDTIGVKNLVLMGINTNTGVPNTPFTAFDYGHRAVVLSDCIASLYGDELCVPGLRNIVRCFGWLVTNEQFFEKLNAGAAAGHTGRTARVSA